MEPIWIRREAAVNTANWIAAIAATAAIASAVFAWMAHSQAKNIFSNQKLLSQRQFLTQLWDYMTGLREVDSESPVVPDVIRNANALELVAVCCEGGMVDKNVIKRTFSRPFIVRYDEISNIKMIPCVNKSGRALLMDCPSASKFYEELQKELFNHGALGATR